MSKAGFVSFLVFVFAMPSVASECETYWVAMGVVVEATAGYRAARRANDRSAYGRALERLTEAMNDRYT